MPDQDVFRLFDALAREAQYTHIQENAMHEVTVKKDELLEIVRKNRDAHRGLFLKAQEGFRNRVIEELDQMLKDAREGKAVRLMVGLAEPQDHTNDYDRVIKMLEMSVQAEITIDGQSFSNFVMDEWSWKAMATHTNTLYASGGKVSR